jgi:hypothetical protein
MLFKNFFLDYHERVYSNRLYRFVEQDNIGSCNSALGLVFFSDHYAKCFQPDCKQLKPKFIFRYPSHQNSNATKKQKNKNKKKTEIFY